MFQHKADKYVVKVVLGKLQIVNIGLHKFYIAQVGVVCRLPGQLQGLGYHWEIRMVQSGGMSEHDALRSATIFGAEGIGLQDDLGSIETGKLADLVVLDANPLDDIRNSRRIHGVMVRGTWLSRGDLDRLLAQWER